MKLKNVCLINPISHARITNAQTASAVLSVYFGSLAALIEEPNNDVDIIFTSGLYQNNQSANPASLRIKLLQREGEWRNSFHKLMRKAEIVGKVGDHELKPAGFALVNWDEQIAAYWNDFSDYQQKLKREYETNPQFRSIIDKDLSSIGRTPTLENLNFIFEETSVTCLWMKGKMATTKRLRESDPANAVHIVYPGNPPAFMLAGLSLLLGKHKDVLPLFWLNTQSDQINISTHRFGRDISQRLQLS